MTRATLTPSSRERTTCWRYAWPASDAMNQPIRPNQMRSTRPLSTPSTAHATIAHPMSWPTAHAHRVALSTSPVIAHSIERSTRPPSSGKPGSRLNTPTSEVDRTRDTEAEPTPTTRRRAATAATKADEAQTARGPGSCPVRRPPSGTRDRASVGSSSICATPPKMNSVIRSTFPPSALTTSEWLSSCARIDSEEQQRRHAATSNRQPHRGAVRLRDRGEVAARKREGDQPEDDEPTRVDLDGNPEDLADAKRRNVEQWPPSLMGGRLAKAPVLGASPRTPRPQR